LTRFNAIGIARHRIATDGEGITTLVAAHGCPLECRYCLNPHCKSGQARYVFTIEELYEKLVCDDLYFEATGGGVTFGGGEPLIYSDFIRDFILYAKSCGRSWRFNLETSLSTGKESLKELDGLIDRYMVDIKDVDPEIYFAYTKKSIDDTLDALMYLAPHKDKVTIRVPLIPGYNTECDNERTVSQLRKSGFTDFDRLTYITDIKSHKMKK